MLEINPELMKYGSELEKNYPVNINGLQKISLFNGDLMEFDITKYDIIYISNLCFNHTFNINLSEKIDKEAKNYSLVFASQDIAFKRSVIKSSFSINQSWGNNSQIFKYELIE